ncbi:Flp family type IVb pilin [Pontitalea aquivivens]|uniref:Flp family type IVb pilin n=1 Tax=Pontitalea aquivivens TaxID=3388663 RepID=UPI0039709FFA
MIKLISYASLHFRHFKKDEDGLALTEYLILLGLLTAAVIAAVLLFGANLGGGWGLWASWLGENVTDPDGNTAASNNGVVTP